MPGSWVVGFLGMSIKLTEVTMSMLYRNTDDPQNPHGGPMWVADKALAQLKPELKWLGKTIAVVQGSSNVGLLKAKCSAAQIKEFAGGGPAVAQAVAADRADAGINDQASAAGYVIEYPDFQVLDGALKSWPLSFATRADETHLLRWLDNYFMLIRNDGRLDKLADYWMRGPAWKKDH